MAKINVILNELLRQVRAESQNEENSLRALFILWTLSQRDNSSSVTYEELTADSSELLVTAAASLNSSVFLRLSKLLDEFSTADFAEAYSLCYGEYLTNSRDNLFTPESISKLACSYLKIESTDGLLELGSGVGGFLLSDLASSSAHRHGIDINPNLTIIARMTATIKGNHAELTVSNVYQSVEKLINKNCNKIFSHFVWASRECSNDEELFLKNYLSDSKKPCFSEWNIVSLINKILPEDGRAVVLGIPKMMFGLGKEATMRELYLKNGFVESIVFLPSGMVPGTGITTVMLVLSRNNKEVNIIDARKIGTRKLSSVLFSDSDIKTITEMESNKGIIVKHLNQEELAKMNYVINVDSLLTDKIHLENPVALKNIAISIQRGMSKTADQLSELESDTPTTVRYLTLASLEDGTISYNTLNYLKEDKSLKKYYIESGTVIVTRTACPFKAAVVEIKPDEHLVAGGNFLIIEPDASKINPYYLKGYLESRVGQVMLKSVMTGTVIKTITAEQLLSIDVPLPSMQVQSDVAEKIKKASTEINELKLKLKNARNSLSSIFG